ncbi:MAG: hypothetical protein J6T81_06095 [Bacteroidales bacterium]|nr:hypothetical protein [Bacteroidales bacterium]
MSDIIKKATVKSVSFWICLIISVLLIITGFFIPPKGAIDGSVLTAVGELWAFATLAVVYHSISMGIDARIKHGKTEVTIGDFENENK